MSSMRNILAPMPRAAMVKRTTASVVWAGWHTDPKVWLLGLVPFVPRALPTSTLAALPTPGVLAVSVIPLCTILSGELPSPQIQYAKELLLFF